uniref:Uncharacterized protein n=1 Tax=Megaselia scalaris TaxID=36166 RepID=T1GNZ4_MEGSC
MLPVNIKADIKSGKYQSYFIREITFTMKNIVLVAALGCFLFQMVEMNPELTKKCIEQEKVDIMEFQKIKNGKIEDPSHNFKCFNKCFMENIGFLVNGKLMEDKVLEALNQLPADKKDKTIAAFNKCKSKTGADDCDTAYQYMACMGENVTL